MTRKHFVQVAESIKKMVDKNSKNDNLKAVIDHLCLTFKEINPAFKADLFKKACGYDMI